MTRQPTCEQRFAIIAEALLKNRSVTQGAKDKKAFGSSALKIHDKIFAMVTSKGQFVVKLPKARVDALVASGEGKRFDPGRGRVMKEWLAVDEDSQADRLALAKEALAFVGAQSRK